jgi:hypothetical protein
MSWLDNIFTTNSSLPPTRMPGVSTGHSDQKWVNIYKLLRMGYKIKSQGSGWKWLRSDDGEYVDLSGMVPKKKYYSDQDIKNYLLSKNFNINGKNGFHELCDVNELVFDFNAHNGDISRIDGINNVNGNVNNNNNHFLMKNYFVYISKHNSSDTGVKKILEFLSKSKDERFLQPNELRDIVQELYHNISRFPAGTQEAQIATEMAKKFIEQYVSQMSITDYEKMNHVNSSLYALIDGMDKKNIKVMEFANSLRGAINKKLNANLPQITAKNIVHYNDDNLSYFTKSTKSTCSWVEDSYECTIKSALSRNRGDYYIDIIKESIEKNDTTKLGTLINVWQKLNPGVNCVQDCSVNNKLKIFGTEVEFDNENNAKSFKQYLNHIIAAKLPYVEKKQPLPFYKSHTPTKNLFSVLDSNEGHKKYFNVVEDIYRDGKYKVYSDACCKNSQDIIIYELLRQYHENKEPNKNKMYKDLTQENKNFINEYKTVKPLLPEGCTIDLEHCRKNGYSIKSIFTSQDVKKYLDEKFEDRKLSNIVYKFVDAKIGNINDFESYVDVSVITNTKNITGTTEGDTEKKKSIIFEGILWKIKSGDKVFIDAITADTNGLKVGDVEIGDVNKTGQTPSENDYKLLREKIVCNTGRLTLENKYAEKANCYSWMDRCVNGDGDNQSCELFPRKFRH